MKSLYISYDGMTDPLGGSQVLPYLEGLSRRGHRFWLISCEKDGTDPRAWERVRKTCAESGISWHPLRYHKSPPVLSTMWDVRAMRRKANALQDQVGFDLAHCRSYVPALIGLEVKRRRQVPFLFDMRGFWPEEKLEGGGWDRNVLLRNVYRWFKQREREFFAEADAIVSLTEAARDEMLARPLGDRPRQGPQVIPCCVDLNHFQPPSNEERREARNALAVEPDAALLCYLGSLGSYYMLHEMLRFFAAMLQHAPDARFLFITREPEADVRKAASEIGLPDDSIIVQAADREDVPRLLAAADFGISFIKPTYSKTACSPTKLGEMMAVGMPVVVNAGVGDVDRVIAETGAGVIVNRFDGPELHAAASALLATKASPEQIRAGAQQWFALEEAIERYDVAYRSLQSVLAAA